MKLPQAKPFVCTALAAFGLSSLPLWGQTAPVSPQAKEEAAVKLDPFSVSADSDVGFVAASSLAGGRIATALKDTPVAYSVVTKEFLEAFNLTDVSQAAQFTTGAYTMDNDGTQRQYGRTEASQITMRGVKVGQPQVNFFNFQYTADSFNLDRVDFARGPNSVLFGAGGVGGTINSVTKQALTTRKVQELKVSYGTYNRYRASVDLNQPINDKAAVRFNAMWSDGDSWRSYEWAKRTGYHIAATYNISPKFTIRGEVEYGDRSESKFTIVRDTVSAWDGKTYNFVAPLTGAGSPTNAFLAAAGIQRRTPMKWVYHKSFGTMPLNFQNSFETLGAAYNADATLTNRILGKPIRTVGFSLRGAELAGAFTGITNDNRLQTVEGGSPYFRRFTQADTLMWSSDIPTYHEKSLSRSIFANYTLGEHLFMELAGNINHSNLFGRSNVRDGLNDVRMDILQTLPNGQPNPNFLRPYSEYFDQRVWKIHTFTNLRAQAVYRRDTRIGKIQAGVMAGQTKHLLEERSDQPLLGLTSIRADARGWASDVEQTQFTYWTRHYVDETDRPFNPDQIVSRPLSLYNPVNGITESLTPRYVSDVRREERLGDSHRKLRFIQAAANLDLFKNRLILIGAFRRDLTQYQQLRFLQAGRMPVGWDGSYLTYRPLPPADYWGLRYFPKDATGKVIGPEDGAFVRPTSIVGGVPLPLPQYAKDRFRDDYSVPIVYNNVNTYTTGAVLNIFPWLGIYGNKSQTYDLSEGTTPLIDGTLGKVTTSDGKDYGVRVTLPNGKMSFSFGMYDASQVGARVTAVAGFTGAYSNIANAPVVGDLSENGANIRGLKTFTFAVQSTVTSNTKGYESELTANFTPNWRMTFNLAKTTPIITDRYPEMIQYYKDTESIIRQILNDAGVIIGADNVAFINPALNDPAKINQTRVTAAANAWNTLQQTVMPNVLGTLPQLQTGQAEWVGNVATDYRLKDGKLKGLRVGLAVNYRSGQVVGFRGSDTIPDPNNPNLAIDDPKVDQYTPVYGNAFYKAVGTMSYTVTLRERRRMAPKTIQFDLQIDNLFDWKKPIYGNLGTSAATAPTKQVPLNGDWTTPANKTVPGNPAVIMPRNYMLSAKLNF
jgi:outer membrane receptor protein involved in Fe transport